MTRDIGIQNSIQKLLQPGTINPIYPLNQINADEIAKNIIQILRNPDPLRIREGREIIEKNFSWKVLGQKALEVFIKAQSA
jgi:glycosyltransferase involved in cell wall biosynthesis